MSFLATQADSLLTKQKKSNIFESASCLFNGVSNSDVLSLTVSAIESVTTKPAQKSAKGYRLQCPAHSGSKHSLFIGDGDKRLIISCHSHHCDPKDIMEAAGLTISDVFYEKLNSTQAKEHHIKVNTRKLTEELHNELVIISLWLGDYSESMYPRNGDEDRARCRLAFQRIQKALKHLETEL